MRQVGVACTAMAFVLHYTSWGGVFWMLRVPFGYLSRTHEIGRVHSVGQNARADRRGILEVGIGPSVQQEGYAVPLPGGVVHRSPEGGVAPAVLCVDHGSSRDQSSYGLGLALLGGEVERRESRPIRQRRIRASVKEPPCFLGVTVQCCVVKRASALAIELHGMILSQRRGVRQRTRESHRTDSGAGQHAGVAGSRVAGGHRAATRSALDAVRRRADSGASGRRLGGNKVTEVRRRAFVVSGVVVAAGFVVGLMVWMGRGPFAPTPPEPTITATEVWTLGEGGDPWVVAVVFPWDWIEEDYCLGFDVSAVESGTSVVVGQVTRHEWLGDAPCIGGAPREGLGSAHLELRAPLGDRLVTGAVDGATLPVLDPCERDGVPAMCPRSG